MTPHYTLDISTATLLRVVFIGAVIALFLTLWQFWAMLFLAVIIATSLEPIIQQGMRSGIPRFFVVSALYLLVLAGVGGVIIFIFPTLFFELRTIFTTLPVRYQEFSQPTNEALGFGFLPEVHGQNIPDLFEAFVSRFGLAASDIFTFAFTVLQGAISFFLTFLISFYLALHGRAVEHFLEAVLPSDHQEYALDLWRRIRRKLGKWLGAQLILIAFIWVTLFPTLWAFGIQYALTLAVFAGFLEIIPVIGPLSAGTLIFIIALFQSTGSALVAVSLYTILEQVQMHFVAPAVVSRALGLSPILIILFLAVGATLAGFWGAMLAIPAGVVLTELFTDLKKR